MSKVEVEQKFRVDSHAGIEARLKTLGAQWMGRESQCDTYLRHPCRDFRVTDEALRIRRTDDQVMVTYKGPKAPGPVKTRAEIEIQMVEGTTESWLQIWSSLGFVPTLQIVKVRSIYQLVWQSVITTIALDTVQDLGCFVEVELVIEGSADVVTAQNHIQALASQLELEHFEKRSYLGMLLEIAN